MKTAIKKIVAVLCCVLLLGAAVTPSVFALGFFDSLGDILGDDLDGILDGIFGGGNNNNSAFSLSDLFSNPGGILDSLRERLASFDIEVSNNAIAGAIASILTNEDGLDLSSLLNSSSFLNTLISYFTGGETTTAAPSTEESTTEESTTEEPSTDVTTTLPPQTSAPTTQPFTNTTAPVQSSEPEYSYVAPSVEYTDQLTTVPFAPVYEEDYSGAEKDVTGKMIVGIAILIVSAVAVVGVVVALKRTKV